MENLFAYGTLMSDEIFEVVTGAGLVGVPGILKGFRRWSVKGERYPAIVADDAGLVNGVVYRNLPEPVWSKLDRYEGPLYRRQTVTVRTADGTALTAAAYVWKREDTDQLDPQEWRFSEFLNRHRADYLKSMM